MRSDLQALTNEEIVGRGLTILVNGLEPFMARNIGAGWSQHSRDSSKMLGVMPDQWNTVFGKVMESVARSWILDIRNARNRWAHHENFSERDSYRIVETIGRLLRSAGCNLDPGPVEHAIRQRIAEGSVLFTPFQEITVHN